MAAMKIDGMTKTSMDDALPPRQAAPPEVSGAPGIWSTFEWENAVNGSMSEHPSPRYPSISSWNPFSKYRPRNFPKLTLRAPSVAAIRRGLIAAVLLLVSLSQVARAEFATYFFVNRLAYQLSPLSFEPYNLAGTITVDAAAIAAGRLARSDVYSYSLSITTDFSGAFGNRTFDQNNSTLIMQDVLIDEHSIHLREIEPFSLFEHHSSFVIDGDGSFRDAVWWSYAKRAFSTTVRQEYKAFAPSLPLGGEPSHRIRNYIFFNDNFSSSNHIQPFDIAVRNVPEPDPQPAPQSVPEPATLFTSLIFLGMLGTIWSCKHVQRIAA